MPVVHLHPDELKLNGDTHAGAAYAVGWNADLPTA
jgi:hypothetical protein